MDVGNIPPTCLRDISNMLGMNKDIEGARQQKQRYEIALKEISNLIKQLKSNRNMKMQKLLGGNLMIPVDNKEAIKDLQDRKKQIDISLNGIEEQIKHREDNLMESYHKVYVGLKGLLPKEMQ